MVVETQREAEIKKVEQWFTKLRVAVKQEKLSAERQMKDIVKKAGLKELREENETRQAELEMLK